MNAGPAVVFDCNILLQALAAPEGPAGRCVQLAFDGKINLFISPVVLRELCEVTSRPKVILKLYLIAERNINLALAAGASFIITRDKDLLDLMDSSHPGAQVFQSLCPALQILDPVKFLSEIRIEHPS